MKQLTFQDIVDNALGALIARSFTCKQSSEHSNNMVDLGWSDKRNKAYWLTRYYETVYQIEKINQRFKRRQD